ncbi:MAG: hypothetical protein U5N86_03455 [Planctomycetota bacterium]|nr:hypothetical protein [Planctomycetota bacterium]
MSRWAIVIIGSVAALYLLWGALLPVQVSSGDDGSAVQAATDVEDDGVPEDRPSLRGKPKPEKTKATKAEGKTAEPETTDGKRWTRDDKKKKRPSLIGPKPEKTDSTPEETPEKTTEPTGPKATPMKTDTVAPVEDGKTIEELRAEIERLKVRINELTANVGDDEAKAKAILDLVATQEKVRKQAQKREAELHYVTAKDLYAGGRYSEAYQKAKTAYRLDPDNEKYARFVRTLAQVVEGSSAAADMSELMDLSLVKNQQQLREIQLNVEEARGLYSEALNLKGSAALEKLKVARTKLGHANFTFNSIPAGMRPEGMAKSIQDLIALVEDKIEEKEVESREYEHDKASRIAEELETEDQAYLAKRIDDLVRRSYIAIHKERYQLAELLLKKVVKLDPGNSEAKHLLRLVQVKGDRAREDELEKLDKLETRRTWLIAEEYKIPFSTVISYPDDWEDIDRRRSGFTQSKQQDLPEWQKLIMAKMERKVTIDFEQKNLQDAISTMQELVGVTIIIDPRLPCRS